MTQATRSPSPIRFRSHSFRALVLAPEPPAPDWLADLDAFLRRSPAFFAGRPVILDLSALPPGDPDPAALIADLLKRDIRVMGVEGVSGTACETGLPPRLVGGRPVPNDEAADLALSRPAPATPSLLVDSPVRSGQSIVFPEGDVTVLGFVSSGAEVVAGGSIHVYGALRGRAVAGSAGNPDARIYCRKFEPELIGINHLINTTDKLDARFRGRSIQARRNGGAIALSTLD